MRDNLEVLAEELWSYYDRHARQLPWREPINGDTFSPYHILVSELMLQQTQVERVIPKYTAFLRKFPSMKSLAAAELVDCLSLWSGLGYNRRAKYLYEIAKALHNSPFPRTIDTLTEYKGIGYNTAAAILVYTYNQPHIFVETNIRTVILYHCFASTPQVTDKQILDKLTDLLQLTSERSYREFYWAMMDYGSFLKRSGIRTNHQSTQYVKQSKFEGSTRQLRGKILRLAMNGYHKDELMNLLEDDRLAAVIDSLVQEKLIEVDGDIVHIATLS